MAGALAPLAWASQLLVLAAAAGAGASEAPDLPRGSLPGRRLAGPMCHADVLVKGMDFSTLTSQERALLGPALCKTLALQNGLPSEAVMTPNGQPGNVGFFSGSYVAPWAPPNRKPYTAGPSTIISTLIDGCDEPKATLAIFRTPAAHRAVEETVQKTIGGSTALEGAPQVLGVGVVPASGSAAPAPPAAAPPAPAPPAAASPAAQAAEPPARVNVAPAPALGAPAPQPGQAPGLRLPPELGGKSANIWLLAGLGVLAGALVAICVCSRQSKKKKNAREDPELLSSDSEMGH